MNVVVDRDKALESESRYYNYWSPLTCLVEEQDNDDDRYIQMEKQSTGIYDTGATTTVGAEEDEAEFDETGQTSDKVYVMPMKDEASATKLMKLKRNELRDKAKEVNLLPGVHSTLVSGVKLADEDYVTITDKNKVAVFDGRKVTIKVTERAVIEGYRDRKTGLWRIPLRSKVENENMDTMIIDRPDPHHAISHVFELPSIAKTITYFHACAGFPPKETWIRAIRKGTFNTWPGLSVKAVNRHFPDSDETQKGHMKALRQGIRSTKQSAAPITAEVTTAEPMKKEHDIFVKVYDTQDLIYTDQTGAFPHVSSRGNRYIMVAVHIDSNYAFQEPMKNRTELEMIRTYQAIVKRMKERNLSLQKHILDNEISDGYKTAIRKEGMEHELLPPNNHRRSIAERCIQHFKSHFIGILCGVDPSFPMHAWCRLLEQAEMTLNLLRQSNVAPNISAHAHVYGPHNFMRHPLAPIGVAVQSYEMPNQRRSWDPRSIDGWYLGTSFEHYRCYSARERNAV